MTDLPTFALWTRTDRDTVCLIGPDDVEITVGELQDRCNQIARNLQARGLRRNDTIAMCFSNHPRVLELWMAATQIGLYVVPINWHLTGHEIRYILQDSGARLVFCDAAMAEACSGTDAAVVCPGGEDDYEAWKTGDASPPPERWAGGPMTYTSGTTGQPKGVRRPLPEAPPEPVASGYAMFLMMYGMQPHDGVHLVVSPMYHTAIVYFASSSLHLGHTVVVMDK